MILVLWGVEGLIPIYDFPSTTILGDAEVIIGKTRWLEL